MKGLLLTENQKKAHDIKRNLSVTANAGSGKTTVLASRFLNILLNTNIKIDELVAITFTEKAAGELRKKIADMLDGIMQNETNETIRAKCQNIRSHFASSNISTIHSFCAKLLRVNPVEANVDVAFTILEGADKKLLIEEAIKESIYDILSDQKDDLFDDLKFLLQTYGKRNLEHYISNLIDKREQVERLISSEGIFNKTKQEILTFWNDSVMHFVDSLVNDKWIDEIKNLLNSLKDQISEKVRNYIDSWHKSTDNTQKKQIFLDICSELLTQEFQLRKNILLKNSNYEVLNNNLIELRDLAMTLKKYIESENNAENDNELLKVSLILLNLYKRVLIKYEDKKLEKSYLDYEDLQLKVREFLKNPEVQKGLSDKYKFIMIDEYQDTNLLQYEIFLPLLSYLKKNNLFIVGDPKQSIFGFRNAEVEIFERTKLDIQKIVSTEEDLTYNNISIPSTEEEKSGRILLAENFRLLTNIIAFVNLVFSNLMKKSHFEFEVEYQELIKGRKNNAEGKVEFLLIRKLAQENEKNYYNALDEECEMIARRILTLKNQKYQIYSLNKSGNSEELAHDFQFQDAAILIRSRTYLKKLEYWLNKYKIPYVISGGIGFYQTQEIYDFYNYFQFLLNNHDEVALVGILRSPFFEISDSELYEIALQDNNQNFWEKVKNYAKTEKSSANLRRAERILSDNINYAARIAIPKLVQKIFKETGWIGVISGIQRGEQSRINIEKLLRIAREFEGRGFTSLFDFVERLRTLIETEEREGQASIETESKAVQIMTIHSAKGLEFPVVFVPFLHKPFRHDNQFIIDANYGLGFDIIDENNKKMSSRFSSFLKDLSKLKSIAEEKRLFYVACTRARDLLILSGNPTNKPNNYLYFIIQSLGITEFSPGELVFPVQKIKSILLSDNKYIAKEFEHQLKIQVYTSIDELNIPSVQNDDFLKPIQLNKIYIDKIKASLKNNFYSATQIQTYYHCPMKFYLKYLLGMPEPEYKRNIFQEDQDPNDNIYNEKLGILVHKVLEKFNNFSEKEITSFIQEFLITEQSKYNDIELITKLISRHIKNYFDSEISKFILSHNEYKTEYTINSVLEDNFITGTLDRIFKANDGNWVIVDYKTDRLKNNDIKKSAETYYYQLGFYALLVSRMYNQTPVDAYLVFTANNTDNFYKFTFDELKTKIIEQKIKEAIQTITMGKFKKNTESCLYCPYLKNNNCIGNSINFFQN